MSLRASTYDPEANAIAFNTDMTHDETCDLENHPLTIIDYTSGKYKPTSLEIIGFSAYIPLSPDRGYCAETDTLTIGEDAGSATLVVENDDLVAYWRYDDDMEDYVAIAVDLRNASSTLRRRLTA